MGTTNASFTDCHRAGVPAGGEMCGADNTATIASSERPAVVVRATRLAASRPPAARGPQAREDAGLSARSCSALRFFLRDSPCCCGSDDLPTLHGFMVNTFRLDKTSHAH